MLDKLLVTSLLIVAFTMCSVISNRVMSATQSPHQLIQHTVKSLNAVVEESRADYQEDPARLYANVTDLLETFFDSDAFAKGVMGPHFSASSKDQRASFSSVLEGTLVRTFTDGLMSMGAYSTTVLPSTSSKPQSKRARVTTKVTTGDNALHDISFSLFQNEDGEWRVRNIVFDGVNVGLTFRSQFDSLVTNSDGSIEAAINNWQITVEQ